MKPRNILILGASYGSLLGTKLALGGHNVKLVCLPAEADAINTGGVRVRMPIKGREGLTEVHSWKLPGKISADGPAAVNPKDYDLVALAMQEPQYRSAGVRELLDAVAKSRVPCMSIMNMPPLPYLARIPGVSTKELRSCYTDPSVWDSFDPNFMTLCSPDPQAFRPPEEKVNVLQVRLPTNFKSARFPSDEHTAMLQAARGRHRSCALRHGIGRSAGEAQGARLGVRAARQVGDADRRQLPLRHQGRTRAPSRTRCIPTSTPRASVYQWVVNLCILLGAKEKDLVPFEKYAAAAQSLGSPSSAARALFAGAPNIERVDRLVQAIAKQKGMQLPILDEVVRLVDARLELNRKKAA